MYRTAARFVKIRKTTTNNSTGDSHALTVPKVIAEKFEAVFFSVKIVDNNIVFESGCKNGIN